MKQSTRYVLEVWLSIVVCIAALTGVAMSIPNSMATEQIIEKVIDGGVR